MQDFIIKQVTYHEIQSRIQSIIDFSTDAYLVNHEITKNAYHRTEDRYKHEFVFLFKESVADMIEQIKLEKGYFFVVFDSKKEKIIAISIGREYGKPALSTKFIELVSKAKSQFPIVMQGWWELMKKFQGIPPGNVYHQAMTAVHPDYSKKGIGTELSEFVMQTIKKNNFVILARENSSSGSDGVVRKLKEKGLKIIDIHSVQTKWATLTLRLQLTEENDVEKVVYWFKNKAKMLAMGKKNSNQSLSNLR